MISDQIPDPHAATSYPVLILDNKIVACDSLKWKDIVPIKKYEYYTDKELALLLGIKVEEVGGLKDIIPRNIEKDAKEEMQKKKCKRRNA